MTDRYVLINNLDIVQGVPWTWVGRLDSTRKSCLDLGIVSASLVPFVVNVIVDVDRKFTPRRVIQRKKKMTIIYTDHFSLMIDLKGMPRQQHLNQHESIWNKGKPGGWDAYEKITDEKADKIDKIIEDLDVDIETVMKELDKVDTQIKFQSFGKTKPKSRKCLKDKLKDKTQLEKDVAIKQKETEKVEHQIEQIRFKNQGIAGNVFRIRKNIVGPKKAGQEDTYVKHPTTGEILVTKEDIKKATLAYCANNLKGNKPDESVIEMVKQRNETQLTKMEEEDDDTLDVDIEDFKEILKKFGSKNTHTYNFLIKAGPKYKIPM